MEFSIFVSFSPNSHCFLINTLRRDIAQKTGKEETKEQSKSSLASLTEGIASAFKGSEENKEKDKSRFSLMSADLLPRIRRGFTGEEKEADPVFSVGWKAVVRSRKEREEVLR